MFFVFWEDQLLQIGSKVPRWGQLGIRITRNVPPCNCGSTIWHEGLLTKAHAAENAAGRLPPRCLRTQRNFPSSSLLDFFYRLNISKKRYLITLLSLPRPELVVKGYRQRGRPHNRRTLLLRRVICPRHCFIESVSVLSGQIPKTISFFLGSFESNSLRCSFPIPTTIFLHLKASNFKATIILFYFLVKFHLESIDRVSHASKLSSLTCRIL